MKVLNVWESLVNSDLTEGRGPMRHVAYFTSRGDAEWSVRGRGVMGYGDGEVKQTEVIIFDNFNEFLNFKDEKLKESALKKLSDEERRVLGL